MCQRVGRNPFAVILAFRRIGILSLQQWIAKVERDLDLVCMLFSSVRICARIRRLKVARNPGRKERLLGPFGGQGVKGYVIVLYRC